MGNAYSFILAQKLAKKYGVRIVLRIDDMDTNRVRSEYVEDIFETLRVLQIHWNEGPRSMSEVGQFSQRSRTQHYNDLLEYLRDNDLVFACNCSRSKLQRSGAEGYDGHCRHLNISLDDPMACWRLKTDEPFELAVNTVQGAPVLSGLPADMNNFIIRKKDGDPSYQLCSLSDDLFFEIDLIVRGEDLWSSTLAQLYLARILNKPAFENCTFFHHPLLMNRQGKKMSKSAGDPSIRTALKKGLTHEHLLHLINSQISLLPVDL
jgi:glutamyl-tRNA synthetase